MIPEGFTTDEHDAEVVAFRAMMAARIAKMGLHTVSEYLADPTRVETIVTLEDVY